MALSSSQFVERRVYDDDVDVAAEPQAVKVRNDFHIKIFLTPSIRDTPNYAVTY